MSELEQKIKELEKSNAYLMVKLAYYEQDGALSFITVCKERQMKWLSY